MADDIGSALNMLKGILGDGAEDKINAVISGLASSDSASEGSADKPILSQATEVSKEPSFPQTSGLDGLQSVIKMKDIMNSLDASSDSRSQLLKALRPYMRGTRQRGIDSAIRLMNLTKMTGLFK